MLTTNDFITIPYTPDMTQGGIAYACKSLAYTYNRMRSTPFKRLQRIVAGVAVELAFRRYLSQNDIPHENLGATPFTDPDRYDISIGGRRCDIKSYLIIHKNQISGIRRDPTQLLEAQALVPEDQIAASHLNDKDLYIFAFTTALLTPNKDALQKACAANLPIFMIHALPKAWSRPEKWIPLGTLALKSDCSSLIKVELGGLGPDHMAISEHKKLQPGIRLTAEMDFHTLHYVHTPDLPDGAVGIHSPVLEETLIIGALDWGNIWVYGMEIIFTGYTTRGDYRKRAQKIPAGSRVFQYPRTSTPNYALPIAELHPLGKLFEKARSWGLQH